MFGSAHEHLGAELQRLDLLLHREILRLQARYQLSLDEFRGLYVSDEQVSSLIDGNFGIDAATESVVEKLTARADALRREKKERLPDDLPWRHLVQEYRLEPLEEDLLLLALAPDLDLKYETLYAYLNNDVTRKWPTRDLALRALASSPEEQAGLRRYLSVDSTLFAEGLLQLIPSPPYRSSWLADGFSVAPPLCSFLLGLPYRDRCYCGVVDYSLPAACWDQVPLAEEKRTALRRAGELVTESGAVPPPVMVFEGREGAGSSEAARALCADFGLPLLRIDTARAITAGERLEAMVHALSVQRRLQRAALFFDACDALFDKEGKIVPGLYSVLAPLLTPTSSSPVIVACSPGTGWRELLRGKRVLHFSFDDPPYRERLILWHQALAQQIDNIAQADVEALAGRFILTPRQVEASITAACDARQVWEHEKEASFFDTLFGCARAESDHQLGALAVKVKTLHSWDDLILPRVTLNRLKEVAAAVRHRHVVYTEWGFERRLALGRGLKVLFAGASGTGKTMTAGVIARDLGVDLYKIDLSGVVSKYIGETEKNLDLIFRAAHSSNAILFFDEADALFGRRSEVKDAHDRYANIEVAYLLQRMEEYEGVVILASNLSKNIDQAFSRRMHYVVEFPLPDQEHRELLWRGMFPAEVPLREDVDFSFLAAQFAIAGGDIRNVALEAAFLAAQDGSAICMKHLVKAIARQLVKQGRVPSAGDFKQYHCFIAEPA